jgi:hypothetical protein
MSSLKKRYDQTRVISGALIIEHGIALMLTPKRT